MRSPQQCRSPHYVTAERCRRHRAPYRSNRALPVENKATAGATKAVFALLMKPLITFCQKTGRRFRGEQVFRKHGIAIAPALAMLDAGQHPLAVKPATFSIDISATRMPVPQSIHNRPAKCTRCSGDGKLSSVAAEMVFPERAFLIRNLSSVHPRHPATHCRVCP